jgi:hypothetical protein
VRLADDNAVALLEVFASAYKDVIQRGEYLDRRKTAA